MENNIKIKKQLFGELVIGPPGSGKTTYCQKMFDFYKQLQRNVSIVNLDPGNENMNYTAEIDIMELITVEDAMNHFELGPNGALMYCMEFLDKNFEWLLKKMEKSTSNYVIFDCAGQVELFTHHSAMRNIFEKLEKYGYRLCTVNLIESHYCSEPHKFISALLLSLNAMLNMGLPHVNVLSKADQIKEHESKMLFSIDYYTEVLDLQYLLDAMDTKPEFKKYKKLNEAIVSLIEGYNLVSFQPVDVNRTESLARLRRLINKANGYVFGDKEEQNINTMLACAIGAESSKEKYVNDFQPYLNDG